MTDRRRRIIFSSAAFGLWVFGYALGWERGKLDGIAKERYENLAAYQARSTMSNSGSSLHPVIITGSNGYG